MAQVDERYADKLVEKLTALGRIRSGQKTATAMKAAAWDDEGYAKAADDLQKAYGYRKLVEALYNAVDRDSFLVSRELTRRIGRIEKDRRYPRNGD
jgi:hypothetical protein